MAEAVEDDETVVLEPQGILVLFLPLNLNCCHFEPLVGLNVKE